MKAAVRKLAIAALALAALLAVAAGTVVVVMVVFDSPGGMPSSYRATDHDARLTPIARSAAPLIAAIDRFYAANGKCPRVTEHDLAELRADLPQDFAGTIEAGEIEFRPRGAANGWRYYSPDAKPTACNLSHKLSWDPALVWLRHGAQTRWVFLPGDGSAETKIRLDGAR